MSDTFIRGESDLPPDHLARLERMDLSLAGLELGDSLGEMLFRTPDLAPKRLDENDLPPGPWFHTDDTEMAISIAAVLRSHGFIHQEALANGFARRFEKDPNRGYGQMTRAQMLDILAGASWKVTSVNVFGGKGSMGNGGAMRVAPLGAYFSDDLDRCVREARLSSLVTHTHPEGIAGTIAVAVGAALACRLKMLPEKDRPAFFFSEVLRLTPESKVRRGIQLASQIPLGFSVTEAAGILGNGSLVTAPDTVPFCLWMAANHSENFVAAVGQTIKAGGDCDTNAAIVGGITAISAGLESIPPEWLAAREPMR